MAIETQKNGAERSASNWREMGRYYYTLMYASLERHAAIVDTLRQQPQIMQSELSNWTNLSEIIRIYTQEEFEKQLGSDLWQNQRMAAYDGMNAILTSGIPRGRLKDPTPLTSEELSRMQACGMGLFQEILQTSDAIIQMELANFLSYNLWLTSREIIESTPGEGQEPSEFHTYKQAEYAHKRKLIIPLLVNAGYSFASRGEADYLELVFQGFKNIDDQEASLALLFDSRFTQEERLTAAVGYINAYGFIKGINILAQSIKSTDDEHLRGQLANIYRKLQGDDVEEVMADLSEVYKAVDFEHYPLNLELTQEECDRIEIVLHKNALRNGNRNIKSLNILDLGAGTGRHMLELIKRGYKKVMGIEQEEKHVDIIRSKNSDANIRQGSWENLPGVIPSEYRPDVIYCLGRTLPHNRTSIEMLKFFDQLQTMLSDNGDIFIDLPDDTGIYKKRISTLRDNAKSLGIKPSVNDIIFDGPDENHKFNRFILRREQVEAMASLFGFRIADAYARNIGEGGQAIHNRYYHLERDPVFDPKSISLGEFKKKIQLLGLFDADTDFETFVQSWGMKLGQAILYTPGNEKIKSIMANARTKGLPENRWGPKISVFEHRGYVELESEGIIPDVRDEILQGIK